MQREGERGRGRGREGERGVERKGGREGGRGKRVREGERERGVGRGRHVNILFWAMDGFGGMDAATHGEGVMACSTSKQIMGGTCPPFIGIHTLL